MKPGVIEVPIQGDGALGNEAAAAMKAVLEHKYSGARDLLLVCVHVRLQRENRLFVSHSINRVDGALGEEDMY